MVVENVASNNGGAIYVASEAKAYVYALQAHRNRADTNGGAVYVSELAIFFSLKSHFHNNTARDMAGAFYASTLSEIALNGTVARGNRALGAGGGAAVFDTTQKAIMHGSTFSENFADAEGAKGGAILCKGVNLAAVIVDTEFVNNAATGLYALGGGIVADESVVQFTRTKFQNNLLSEGTGGGAVAVIGDSDVSFSAAATCGRVRVVFDFTNTTENCRSFNSGSDFNVTCDGHFDLCQNVENPLDINADDDVVGNLLIATSCAGCACLQRGAVTVGTEERYLSVKNKNNVEVDRLLPRANAVKFHQICLDPGL